MANVGNGNSGDVLIGQGRFSGPTFAPIGTNSGLTAHGVLIAQGAGAFVSTPTGSVGQVLTSNGSSADPSFQTISGGLLPWTDETSSKFMIANNGYTVSGVGLVALTLPLTCAYGSIFRVAGNGNTWTINYNSGQQIRFGNSTTTLSTGSLVSTGPYDAIEILCTVANTTFVVINGPQGNITVN